MHEGAVEQLKADAKWFQRLYIRWTVVYWAFTLFSSGTAVSAAIKSSLPSQRAISPSGTVLDWVVLTLATLTVLSTVMVGVLKPEVQANAYRAGDLILQKALMTYEFSQKDPEDSRVLLAEWNRAIDFLPLGVHPTNDRKSRTTPANQVQKTHTIE